MKFDKFDHELRNAMMCQVILATPDGGTEKDVTTVITRPMWRAWCKAVGQPKKSEPTENLGVYGSRTIVVESEALAAVSFRHV